MPHLCPCSGSCLHHGAPEPRRCRWMHHWEQQPGTHLENGGSGRKAVRGLLYLDSLTVHTRNYTQPLLVCRSTSTVGLPLESRISLAKIVTMDILSNRGVVITFPSMTSTINPSQRGEQGLGDK